MLDKFSAARYMQCEETTLFRPSAWELRILVSPWHISSSPSTLCPQWNCRRNRMQTSPDVPDERSSITTSVLPGVLCALHVCITRHAGHP
ncbi:hypothetical protein PLICRDRAFT_92455 [Plicaturopsis crispa FD-325 SS-3]|nr:hypothetical protein PLICRDRAFT_92455 [Plicaturopsis crispa FD-325 SS-3]